MKQTYPLHLPVVARTVDKIEFYKGGPAIHLCFLRGDHRQTDEYVIQVGGSFTFDLGDQTHEFDPEKPASSQPASELLSLLGKQVVSAFAEEDATLRVLFATGERLTVPFGEWGSWEFYEMNNPNGWRIEAWAGSGLAVRVGPSRDIRAR